MTQLSKEHMPERDDGGFAGTLRNIQLIDIIQMCCLAGASLSIRVNKDAYAGTIYIQEGDIVHAECGDMTGVPAFFAILGWQSGHFETLASVDQQTRTIKEPCQFLLMEAARFADEKAQEADEDQTPPVAAEPLKKLKVLVVDDSPIMSRIISSMMAADPLIDVVGTAKNGQEALKAMKSLQPELITMDVNMPVMDGSTALKHIMIESPSPVLIMSNLGPASYDTILTFLNLGAVDFMSKPVRHKNILVQQQKMVDRVHLAAKAKVRRFKRIRRAPIPEDQFATVRTGKTCKKLVVVNSGVGGYLEMVNVITAIPADMDACFISLQSIPPHFAPTLAAFLNNRSRFDVRSFNDDAPLCAGRCYIGTKGTALQLVSDANVPALGFEQTESEEKTKETSFDEVLRQVVEIFNDRVVVVLLSGADLGSMEELRRIHAMGGQVIAPKLASCILPATLEPAVDEGLITELFDPSQIEAVFKRLC